MCNNGVPCRPCWIPPAMLPHGVCVLPTGNGLIRLALASKGPALTHAGVHGRERRAHTPLSAVHTHKPMARDFILPQVRDIFRSVLFTTAGRRQCQYHASGLALLDENQRQITVGLHRRTCTRDVRAHQLPQRGSPGALLFMSMNYIRRNLDPRGGQPHCGKDDFDFRSIVRLNHHHPTCCTRQCVIQCVNVVFLQMS